MRWSSWAAAALLLRLACVSLSPVAAGEGDLPQAVTPHTVFRDVGPLLLDPLTFSQLITRDQLAKLAADPWTDFCNADGGYRILRRARKELKYSVLHSPAWRLAFAKTLDAFEKKCPEDPAGNGADGAGAVAGDEKRAVGKTKQRLMMWTWAMILFHYLLLSADLLENGRVVLTPEQVVRYSFPKNDTRGDDPFDDERENSDEDPPILRGPGCDFEEWDDDPGRDGELAQLRAADPEVDRQLLFFEKRLRERTGVDLNKAAGGADAASATDVATDNSSRSAATSEEGRRVVLTQAHLYWLFYDHTEAEIVFFLEHLEAFDAMLPSDHLDLPPAGETWTSTRKADARSAERLPAEVSAEPVEWRPEALATVEIPYAAYPVVPLAARQRHWLTIFAAPLVTGRDAQTNKPIVRFLRLVNTRASKKTELLQLVLRDIRRVLSSKGDFERIVDPQHRPYLKWFLTVKHPKGAPEEYLQELRDLDEGRRSWMIVAWSLAGLQLLLIFWAGAVLVCLYRRNQVLRRNVALRGRKSRREAAPNSIVQINK